MSKRYGGRGGDRRRTPSTIRNKPRPSPANLLILGVIGVLAASAAAAAFFGSGIEDTTPHGQVLTALQVVADAQEEHYRTTGAFADWLHTLEMNPSEDVQVGLVRGSATEWEATASHSVGITCIQEGRLEAGRPQREAPICYNMSD